jgi:ketosteroid isomerase-like protein
VDRDKDRKLGSPSSAATNQDSEGVPAIGPRNPALGEIYQRLYPEIRRPKPNQEAIAAALQAMQRLTMEADSESVAQSSALESPVTIATTPCRVCRHHNRIGNKFCGACGGPLGASQPKASDPPFESLLTPVGSEMPPKSPPQTRENPEEINPSANSQAGTHHYHHHYHHHYFQGGSSDGAAAAPRASAPESAREADRLRVAAAAKGEPMSRGEAAVRRLTQEWVVACNTRQLDELIELYATDALVLRSNLPPIRGAIAVREFFFSSLEAGLGEVAVEPLRVEVVGDMAHEVGRYSALVPGSSGKRREERGKYLWVFAKQTSGDWKLVSECWSADLTLPGGESEVPKSAMPPGSKIQPRR